MVVCATAAAGLSRVVAWHCYASPFWLVFYLAWDFTAQGASWIYVSVHDYGPCTCTARRRIDFSFPAAWRCYFYCPCCAGAVFCRIKRWGVSPRISSNMDAKTMVSQLGFTGFPWLFIGYSQTKTWISRQLGARFWRLRHQFLLAFLSSTPFDCLQQRRCTVAFCYHSRCSARAVRSWVKYRGRTPRACNKSLP